MTGSTTLGIFEAGSGSSLTVATQVPDSGSGGIPCGDVQSFWGSCKRQSGLNATVNFSTSSHNGESVVIGIDGATQVVTISGQTANFHLANPASGPRRLTLEDPAGCVTPVTVTCLLSRKDF